MKKFFAVILALAMTFALSATALAANPPARDLTPAEQEANAITFDIGAIINDGFDASGSHGFIMVGDTVIAATKKNIVFEGHNGSVEDLINDFVAGNDTWENSTADPKGNIAALGYKVEKIEDTEKIKILPLKSDKILSPDAEFKLRGIGGAFTPPDGIVFPPAAVDFEGYGSITINNATIGCTYSVYKVFDATYSDGAVSYTYTKTGADDSFYDALIATGSPFTLTQLGSSNTYQVTIVTGKTGADVAAWLKTNEALLGEPEATSAAATTDQVVFYNLPYGYYYIKSNCDSEKVVTIDTLAPDVVVNNKNNRPGPDEFGKKVWDGKNWVIANTGNIGDTVKFAFEYFAPKHDIGYEVEKYVITDTLGAGFDLNESSIKIFYRDGAIADDDWHEISRAADQCVVAVTENTKTTFTITLYPKAIPNYPENAHIRVEYDAVINKDINNTNSSNNVDMAYTYVQPPDGPTPPDPIDPDPPTPTETKVYGFNLQKIKGGQQSDTVQLEGAEFSLWDAETNGNKIKLVFEGTTNGVNKYRVATANETNDDPIIAGLAFIHGLKEGTYWLQEDVAPEGYNPQTSRTKIELNATNCGNDYIFDNGNTTEANAPVQIENNAGSELPSTGGIGTTIFYVVGSLLMVGAAVLLIVRKKMSVMD